MTYKLKRLKYKRTYKLHRLKEYFESAYVFNIGDPKIAHISNALVCAAHELSGDTIAIRFYRDDEEIYIESFEDNYRVTVPHGYEDIFRKALVRLNINYKV